MIGYDVLLRKTSEDYSFMYKVNV